MPQDKEKVSVYFGPKSTYDLDDYYNNIDENGIYFTTSKRGNEIYVGHTLFSAGSGRGGATNLQHVVFHRTGSLLYTGQPLIYELSDLPIDHGSQGIVTGVFINGLRSVSEIQATLNFDIDPVQLSIFTYHDYLDPLAELTIDMLLFDSNDPKNDIVIEIEENQNPLQP